MSKLELLKIQVDIDLVEPKDALSFARLEMELEKPRFLAPEYGQTEIKLEEARFYLELLRKNAPHQAIVIFALSAFLSAARSVTLYLQAEGKDKPGFKEWYEQKREELKTNEFARFLVDTRNISAHKMYSDLVQTVAVDLAPKKRLSIGFEFEKYNFKPGLHICDEFLDQMAQIVAEAKERKYLEGRGYKGRFILRK